MKNNPRNMNKLPMALAVLAFVFAGLTLAMQVDSGSKIGYVDNTILFERFDGKKELERKLIRIRQEQQSVLDSLRLFSGAPTAGEGAGRLMRVRDEFTQNLAEQSEAYTAQVWSQINAFVKEYGAENGYAYILGAAGNGSLMYADPGKDITEDVLEFINKKYAGY